MREMSVGEALDILPVEYRRYGSPYEPRAAYVCENEELAARVIDFIRAKCGGKTVVWQDGERIALTDRQNVMYNPPYPDSRDREIPSEVIEESIEMRKREKEWRENPQWRCHCKGACYCNEY